jgi:integrase
VSGDDVLSRLEAAALAPRTRAQYAVYLRAWEASGMSASGWWLSNAETRSLSWLRGARTALTWAGAWDAETLGRAYRGAARLAREREPRRRQAPPLSVADLDRVVRRRGESSRRVERRAVDLMVIGWWGAMRVSELSALRADDLEVEDRGVTVTIRASKGSPEPVSLWLPARPGAAVCPAVAARRLLMAGRVELWPLSCRTLERRIADILRSESAAGVIRRGRYTSHSLRAGLATELDAAGVAVGSIARAGRWRSLACVLGYVRERGDSPLSRVVI